MNKYRGEQSMEQQTPPTKKSANRPRPIILSASLFLLPVFFLLGFASGWLIWGRDAGRQAAVAAAEPSAQEPIQRVNVSLDDDPAVGPADAPITIVEFSDYQCPYCQRWHEETFQALMDAYPGQIHFVYRDFPLYSLHPQAEPAAVAANCANEQGKFWNYHDLLFSKKFDLGKEAYLAYAEELGLDKNAFETCLSSDKYVAEVSADYTSAGELGVNSTPTFFVNGIALVGAQPLSVFQQVIDMELAGQIP